MIIALSQLGGHLQLLPVEPRSILNPVLPYENSRMSDLPHPITPFGPLIIHEESLQDHEQILPKKKMLYY